MNAPDTHDTQALTWGLLAVVTVIGLVALVVTPDNAFGIIWTSAGAAGLLGAAATRWRSAAAPSPIAPWVCFLLGLIAAFTVMVVVS